LLGAKLITIINVVHFLKKHLVAFLVRNLIFPAQESWVVHYPGTCFFVDFI